MFLSESLFPIPTGFSAQKTVYPYRDGKRKIPAQKTESRWSPGLKQLLVTGDPASSGCRNRYFLDWQKVKITLTLPNRKQSFVTYNRYPEGKWLVSELHFSNAIAN